MIFRNFYDIIKVELKFGKEFFMQKIRIGIVGYGNLGKGVEYAVSKNADTELAAVFSRRDPGKIKTVLGAPVFSIEEIKNFKDKIDVMIMCGGSASDLPVQSVEFVKEFSIVDSFDTHAKIPEHFDAVDAAAKAGGDYVAFSSMFPSRTKPDTVSAPIEILGKSRRFGLPVVTFWQALGLLAQAGQCRCEFLGAFHACAVAAKGFGIGGEVGVS